MLLIAKLFSNIPRIYVMINLPCTCIHSVLPNLETFLILLSHYPFSFGNLYVYPPAIAVRDIVIAAIRLSVCLSVCPSVTLSCLCNNLSKHGWIWIIFCVWHVIIIILDGFLHGNIWIKVITKKQEFWGKILVFDWKITDFENCV